MSNIIEKNLQKEIYVWMEYKHLINNDVHVF